jgi:hypothetical protein
MERGRLIRKLELLSSASSPWLLWLVCCAGIIEIAITNRKIANESIGFELSTKTKSTSQMTVYEWSCVAYLIMSLQVYWETPTLKGTLIMLRQYD